jgi:hypothetical protein
MGMVSMTDGDKKPDSGIAKALGADGFPPLAAGFVRPLTDPEAVERWHAQRETPEAVFEYNPFARSRLP